MRNLPRALHRKAAWIADILDENLDDVYDVLLENITMPNDLVSAVNSASLDYDEDLRSHTL